MKKNFLLVVLLLVFGVVLSACEESPGIELSSLPEDFYVQKAIESGDVQYPPTKEFIVHTPPNPEFPSGDYILLKNIYGTNLFRLSFFSDGKEVCHWEEDTSHPYSFQEKGTINISEPNCPGMGNRIIFWDLSQELASLNGEEIPVWTLTGSQYFKN